MLSAMIITLGGSIGAVFVCYGIDRLKFIPGLLLKLLVTEIHDKQHN